MTTLRDIARLRQLAAQHAGEWKAERHNLYNDSGEPVATCRDAGYATYLAGIHNTWLLLANAWLMITRTLKDRKAITALVNKEQQ